MNFTQSGLVGLALLYLLFPSLGSAATEASGLTTINRMISYNKHGEGDVVFTVDKPTSGCYGYWLTKADPGFDANLSMILAAYHGKTIIKVYGLDDQKWTGSANFWCKLYAIEYPQ
jgi:hypothetical protein